MIFANTVLLASAGLVSASTFSSPSSFDFSALIKRKASCPTYWQQISKDLNAAFLDNGQCNANARAAVRYAFHDAGPYSTKFAFVAPAGGGADGSLLLNPGEMSRGENGGLEDYNTFIGNKLATYRQQFGPTVGAADLIQFASRYVEPVSFALSYVKFTPELALLSSPAPAAQKSRLLSAVPTPARRRRRILCRQVSAKDQTTTACFSCSSTKDSMLLN